MEVIYAAAKELRPMDKTIERLVVNTRLSSFALDHPKSPRVTERCVRSTNKMMAAVIPKRTAMAVFVNELLKTGLYGFISTFKLFIPFHTYNTLPSIVDKPLKSIQSRPLSLLHGNGSISISRLFFGR